jgi:catechol 2,3-dioxygenase-like lactoylglutathione lyase family enzyme
MITGIDHIALVVRDLDQSVANYRALLGREPNWRGSLEGAQHAWFQLPNVALDVIAPKGGGRFGERAQRRLDADGEGIWALGLSVGDLDAASRTVERRGIAIVETTELVSTNDADETRSWRFASLATEISSFLVQAREESWPLSDCTDSEETAAAGLDHIVVRTANADRAVAFYGARLGLDLRLDRTNAQWGSRLLFFRCGDSVIEIAASLKNDPSAEPDAFGGLAWRVRKAALVHARLAAEGFDVSGLRKGRKPGTQVFTVRNRTCAVPTLMLESGSSPSSAD